MFRVNFLNIDKDNFLITEHVIANECCNLIRPSLGLEKSIWTKDNLHLRSSLYNSEGYAISCSFPKFFNLDERTDLYPFDGDITECSLIEKIDGSTLIVSRYRGEYIIRTRGSVDAEKVMANGDEISYFKNEKYKLFFNSLPETTSYSFLFEWVSPRNRIILDYKEPELYLTGIIDHNTYSLTAQSILDNESQFLGFKRPQRFHFKTFKDLVQATALFRDKEGICLYYDKDQHITKVKSIFYLNCHAFKSSLSINSIIQFYLDWGFPTRSIFEGNLDKQFDHECLLVAKDLITSLYDLGVVKVREDFKTVINFVEGNSNLVQKDFALKLKESNLSNIVKSWCFSYRKNKEGDFSPFIKETLYNSLRINALTDKMSYKKMVLLNEG